MFRGKKQFIHNILFDHTKQTHFYIDGKKKKLKKPNIVLKNKDLFTVFDTRRDKKQFTHKGANNYKANRQFQNGTNRQQAIFREGCYYA